MKERTKGLPVVVYGMTIVGKALVSHLKGENEIAYCIDRKMDGERYSNIPIYGINHFEDLDKNVVVIIALDNIENIIKGMLRKSGYTNEIIGISELIPKMGKL